MTVADERKDEAWHLKKGVPITFIAFLIFQTILVVRWADKQDHINETQNMRLDRLETITAMTDSSIRNMNERLARIEEKSSSQVETLNRIEAMIRGKR